jgi:hypothetical protein
MGRRPVLLIEAAVYGAEAEPLLAGSRRHGMVGLPTESAVLHG